MDDPRVAYREAFERIDNTPGMGDMERHRAKAKLEGLAAMSLIITPDGRGVTP